MDELADSSGIAGDPEALRKRMAADGYLFFRGLLPAGQVEAIGTAVAGRLRSGGWTDDRGIPSVQPRAVNSMDAMADPAFRAAAVSAPFNQIPYLPPLRSVVRRILGPLAFSYPAKVLRAVYPERPDARTRGRYVHYDYGVSGVQDMLTTWLPLMDIPVRLGGLAVRPGGHLGPPVRPRVLGRIEPGWATTGYRPGDVIIFHCMTPHAALPNTARRCGCPATSAGSCLTGRPPLSSSWARQAARTSCSAGCSGTFRGGNRCPGASPWSPGCSWLTPRLSRRASSPCTAAGGAGGRPLRPSTKGPG